MKIIGVTNHPTEDTSVLSKQNVDDAISQGASLVSGTIVMFSHNVIPSGWVLCNGQELSQLTYASLYSVLLSTYNSHPTLGAPAAGNFRVPDFRDLFPLAVNPSGGATTLGIYSTTGWNHTHTIGNHTHGLPAHTHTLSSHTHTVDSHFHSLDNHSHSIPSHNHSIPYHSHWFPAHYHLHSLNVTVTHRHPIQAKNTGTTGTAAANPRSGNIAPNNNTTYNTASGGAYTVSVSGTIGAGTFIDDSTWGGAGMDYLNQEPYNTNGVNIRTNTSSDTAIASGNTESTSTQASFTTGASSSVDSGPSSSNITNSSGSATTGAANPPYIGLNFIIKV